MNGTSRRTRFLVLRGGLEEDLECGAMLLRVIVHLPCVLRQDRRR
jgi:hypothetical protein